MGRKIGTLFEKKAVSFLNNKAYSIVETNYFFKSLEIDIIALSPDNILIFIEVKYRKTLNNSFNIYDTINRKKQKRISKCAGYFLNNFPSYQKYYCRFDVIFFYHQENLLKIEHLKNAF